MGLVHILGNDNGVIYVVNSVGELLFYKDLAQDGTNLTPGGPDKWPNNNGAIISTGLNGTPWNKFSQVFSGGDGIIYAINSSGELLFCKDLARDGTNLTPGRPDKWPNNNGTIINTGLSGPDLKDTRWNQFSQVFSGGDGIIYVVHSEDLFFCKDLARDGADKWSNNNGKRIGKGGWDQYSQVFSGGSGIIYALYSTSGQLLFYKDLARDGTNLDQPGTDKFVDGTKIVEGWAF